MLSETASPEISADSLTRTIKAVFEQSEYRRTVRRSLLEEVFRWISTIIDRIQSAIDVHPALRYALAAIALLLIGATLARVVYVRQMQQFVGRAPTPRLHGGETEDPWTIAHRAATAGNFLEAAHSLYLAVLETLARSDNLVLDSAKTVGDYTRDLRKSSSPSLALYREFARLYEPVVWGARACDNQRFEQLSGIATRLSGRRA